MSFRKSLTALRDHERNVRRSNGQWVHKVDEVDGFTFNERAQYEPPGFARGARVSGYWKAGMRGGSR